MALQKDSYKESLTLPFLRIEPKIDLLNKSLARLLFSVKTALSSKTAFIASFLIKK